MFKKCEFLTLIRLYGEIQAVKVFGYTDGKYMYYNTNHHCNLIAKARGKNGWFCVHPEIGIAFPIPYRTSRKLVRTLVYSDEMQTKLAEYMEKQGKWAKRKFSEYVKKYEERMVWKNETA